MLRTNAGLRLSLVVKCLIVINLSMHEDISIVGISCVHDVLKKKHLVLLLFGGLATFGGSLFSGFIKSYKVLMLLSGGRYFRRVGTIGTLQ